MALLPVCHVKSWRIYTNTVSDTADVAPLFVQVSKFHLESISGYPVCSLSLTRVLTRGISDFWS